jgi:hypothetical protein
MSMTPQRKPKQVKARRMFSTYTQDGDVLTDAPLLPDSKPVLVLDGSQSAYEALVEQGARARFIAYEKLSGCTPRLAERKWVALHPTDKNLHIMCFKAGLAESGIAPANKREGEPRHSPSRNQGEGN